MRGGTRNSFWIGWESAKANAVPMVVLWMASVALVFGYYFVPGVAAMLAPLKSWQDAWGWKAAFGNGFVFCGLLPGFFLLTVRALKVERPFPVMVTQSLWSGIGGVIGGWMYALNAAWLGEGLDFPTLAAKTAICQFLWTPVVFNPLGATVYAWIGGNFSLKAWRGRSPIDLWLTVALPNLLVNWAIWIPCTFIVSMFPTPLQIQLSGLINCFFALVQLSIGWRKT